MASAPEQSYALTLVLLLQVLLTHPHLYHLTSTLPAEMLPVPTKRGERYAASVRVVQGQVLWCQIVREPDGTVVLEGQAAMDCLASCEHLVWQVQTLPAAEHAPTLPLPEKTVSVLPLIPDTTTTWLERSPPRLRCSLTAEMLDMLSRRQRQIVLLLNGQRGIGDLCPLVGVAPEQLLTVLDELEGLGLIAHGSP